MKKQIVVLEVTYPDKDVEPAEWNWDAILLDPDSEDDGYRAEVIAHGDSSEVVEEPDVDMTTALQDAVALIRQHGGASPTIGVPRFGGR
jgi:hypothetical protein